MTTRRIIHALIVVLLLLAGAAFGTVILGADPEPPSVTTPEEPPVESRPEVAAAAARLAELPTDAESEPWEEPHERVEVELGPAPEGAGIGPVVRVIDGDTRVPVASVPVHYVERDAARQAQRRAGGWVHDLELPALHGIVRHSDAEGRVPLPIVEDRLLVAAEHDGKFAAAALRPGRPREVTLVLQRDETLRVKVSEPQGAPRAGVSVGIYQGREFGRRARSLSTVVSGRDGLATLRHFQLIRRRREDGERFAAAARLPLQVPAAVEFRGEPAPEQPVELTVGATALVELRLVDRHDTTLLSEGRLGLRVVRPDGFSLPLPVDDGFDRVIGRKRIGEEPVVVEVGLGLVLHPFGRLDGDGQRWFGAPEVTGPTQPQERVRVPVPLPGEYAVLRGQLVEADDRPLTRRMPMFDLTAAARSTMTGRARTLEDGRFELLPRLDGKGPVPDMLELRVGLGEDGLLVGVRERLPALRAGDSRDLGVLRLGELEPIAGGVVVNDIGQPVLMAGVRLQVYGTGGDREEWFDSSLARDSTDEEGVFWLQGIAPPGQRLRVRVAARDHLRAYSAEISPGADLRIVLTRTGAIRGSALVPRWIPDEALSLRLFRVDDSRNGRNARLRRRGERASFRIDRLTPGVYDLQFLMRNLRDPLLSVQNVSVQPGDNEDPRLQGIDLRNSVFRYRLRAVGSSGARLPLEGPVLARFTAPDGQSRQSAFRWRRGRAELIMQSPVLELVLFGEGCLPTVTTLSYGDHDVYIRELHPAVINMPGVRSLCGFQRKVRVSMVYTKRTGLPEGLRGVDQRSGDRFNIPRWQLSKSGGAWLNETDRVEVPLSRNGPHQVILRLYEDGVERNVSVLVGVAKVVLDGPAPVSHTLRPDAQKIAAAIAELQQRKARSQQRAQQPGQQRGGRGNRPAERGQRGRGGRGRRGR